MSNVARCEYCDSPLVNLAARRCDLCERAMLATAAIEHSPAPWKLDYGEIYSTDGRVVARKDFRYNHNDSLWLADAGLIVEAPALLALARYAAERGEGDAEMARDILARIKGAP